MKFSILQQDLLPALQSVSRAVGVRATLPVLENILLSVEGSLLKIAATNLEIGVIRSIPVEEAESGEVTVPAKTMLDLVSGLKQSKIEIYSNGSILTIKSSKFKANINGISAEEFPVIPLSAEDLVTLERDVITASSQILYAAAVDEGRPVLTGVYTYAKGEKLDFVATDGFRLAHRQIIDKNLKSDFQAIIPKKTFEEVLRLLAEDKSHKVGIAMSDDANQVIFKFENSRLSSRLIEGNYPDWEKIIPTKSVTKIKVEKDDLIKAIKLAAVFARNEANVVTLKMINQKIGIESATKELGSQENEVEGEVEGEDLKVAFNVKFLLDAISNIPTDQLSIQFSGALSPALIKPAGDLGLEYVVMPVRVN